MSENKNIKLSIINFIKETINPNSDMNRSNKKWLKWGIDNQFPMDLMVLSDTVPEHSSALNFTESLIIEQGLNIQELDFEITQKITSDYLLFGGYSVIVTVLRNGTKKYEHIDMYKCRYSEDEKFILICEKWGDHKSKVAEYPVSDGTTNGIFIYKNIKSRFTYPRPHYLASNKSIETLSKIIAYHNNNASNGFSPNVLININGAPEPTEQEEIEKRIKEKFTGDGQKFILSFFENEQTKTEVVKLQDDNLDAKFKELQLFLRDEIIIGHRITSGELIGVPTQGKGFSKTEFDEALSIFKEYVVLAFRNELTYSFTKLTGIENIQFLDKTQKQNITVDNTTPTTNDGGTK